MLLEVDGIEFSYDSTPILKGVTFEVKRREMVAILGPNGAGKSTLLKCINGILKPKGGVVMVEGLPGESYGTRERAKKMGYVPQTNTGNFMTVFDAVLLGRKPYIRWGPGERDLKLVEETLKLVGLESLALKRTNSLSGGELQKVVVARALVQKPRVLLLDEFTNNLDLKNQLEVMKLVSKITHESGVASIVVMHDINLALRYSDKFVVMAKGAIHARGGKEIIEPQLMKEVYGIEVLVGNLGGVPLVVPIEGGVARDETGEDAHAG